MNTNLSNGMTEKPLVSIIVITYNSSKFVLETLESAKAQTYQNIELIVSDDCSIDDTVELCRLWIEKNKERFVRTELVTVVNNTGIAPNCNRGLYSSEGVWVKLIAGDDILLPNCINTMVGFINKEKKCKVLFAQNALLREVSLGDHVAINKFNDNLFELSAKKQFKQIVKGVALNAQGSFYNRLMLQKIGGFEESYPFMEDWPLYVKISENGYRFFGLNSIVALYRQHDNNISSSKLLNNYINAKFYKSYEDFIIRKIIFVVIKRGMIVSLLNFTNKLVVMRIILIMGNKQNLFSKLISTLYIPSAIASIKRLLNKLYN